ncbi:MAG: hypothetical protein NTU79_22955, partial [Planctomycetota bacterium]|nr:hypothetical protein [Planctomycetota bacterium]
MHFVTCCFEKFIKLSIGHIRTGDLLTERSQDFSERPASDDALTNQFCGIGLYRLPSQSSLLCKNSFSYIGNIDAYDHGRLLTQLFKVSQDSNPTTPLYPFLPSIANLVLRSTPDVVATWDDTEVARRWWTLCPKRKVKQEIDGQSTWIPAEATEWDLNSIRNDPVLLAAIRLR